MRGGSRLSLFAGLLLLTAACRRPLDETRFLNFDPESSEGKLTSGWSGWEKTGAGDTFVWSLGKEAKARAISRGDGDRTVRFRCWPFRFEGAVPQTVTLFVNDAKIETVTLADEPHVYAFDTPKAVWRRGDNELRFAFAYAEAPRDRVKGADDTRVLSAAFDWIEILPIFPSPKK